MVTRWSSFRLVVLLTLAATHACSNTQGGGNEASVGGAGGNGGATAPADSMGGIGTNVAGGARSEQGGNAASGATGNGSSSGVGGVASSGGASSSGGKTDPGGASGTTGATNSSGTSSGTSSGGGVARDGGASGVGGGARSGGASGLGGSARNGGASGLGGSARNGGASGAGGAKSTTTIGTAGVAGAPLGVPLCATAAEGASATITCPEGQIIDSVVFASYGNPTGTCGSFTPGSCNSATSQSVVTSMCVGRRACTVAASNNSFGDPCRSTAKNLAVQVACAPGTPIAGSNTPYKGVANSPAGEIAALGATWCYNWMTTPKASDCNDPHFVPMIWDGSNVVGAIKSIGDAGYTTVLGFNEPNKTDQANMTVDSAIALWPTITSNPSIRVGSPAVSDDGRAWLESFMTQAKAKGLRVDFIAMHWYGWNSGSCTAGSLEGAVNWASKWGLPIWITEFGCMGSSNPNEQTLLNFFNAAIPMLASHPLVERYAWYPWNTYNHLYENGTITALGKAFAAAPQYRQ